MTVQEAGEAEEYDANKMDVTNEGDNEGDEIGEGRIGVAPVLYQRDSIVMEKIGGVMHRCGGCPLKEGVLGAIGNSSCIIIRVGERGKWNMESPYMGDHQCS